MAVGPFPPGGLPSVASLEQLPQQGQIRLSCRDLWLIWSHGRTPQDIRPSHSLPEYDDTLIMFGADSGRLRFWRFDWRASGQDRGSSAASEQQVGGAAQTSDFLRPRFRGTRPALP